MDASTITRRDGTEVQKRPIILRDDSGRSIELTLWGKYVTESGDALSMVGCVHEAEGAGREGGRRGRGLARWGRPKPRRRCGCEALQAGVHAFAGVRMPVQSPPPIQSNPCFA